MKYHALVIGIIALFLNGCITNRSEANSNNSSSNEKNINTTKVFIKENQIIYTGDLTPDANNKLISLYEQNKNTVDTITINSNGGDIGLGMDLGEFIFDNGLNVFVSEYCFSSCANYVFPSGKTKYLGRNAFVGFHGSAFSVDFVEDPSIQNNEALKEQFKQYIAEMKKREAALYKKIKVNPMLPILGQNGNYNQYNGYDGWYYTNDALNLLGLKNIVVTNPPWIFDPHTTKAKLFKINRKEVALFVKNS